MNGEDKPEEWNGKTERRGNHGRRDESERRGLLRWDPHQDERRDGSDRRLDRKERDDQKPDEE